MNLQVTQNKHNTLMARKEITAVLAYEKATPSKTELKNSLATAMKLDANLLVIKQVMPGFGNQKAAIKMFHYDNVESMAKFEPKKKVKKAKKGEEKKE